jgi:signal transduction histidine kinase
LLVGHIAWERERLITALKQEFNIGLLLALLMATALAYAMSRAIAKALSAPLIVAKQFADGDRKARVTPNGSGDSFHQLALHLNAMFSRIEDLVNGIAHTTDAIAHDLRTPLTRLKTQLESARIISHEPKARLQIEQAITETDRLLAIFQAMLRLARLEADKHYPVEPVELNALINDAAELFEAVAESEGQQFRLKLPENNSPILIPGDRDQLFQLMVNLLDNAIKYTHKGSLIQLELSQREHTTKIVVSDDGPGIPPHDRERVFDRFVRLESHRGSPGNGLGLPLVRAIVMHHQGKIYLEDAEPGLRVVIEFPLFNADASSSDLPHSLKKM